MGQPCLQGRNFTLVLIYTLSHQLWMEHTGKSEKELQAALKEWYTIDESPATVEQMVEAQNWVLTSFTTTSFIATQDKSIQPPLRNISHPKGIATHGKITFEPSNTGCRRGRGREPCLFPPRSCLAWKRLDAPRYNQSLFFTWGRLHARVKDDPKELSC